MRRVNFISMTLLLTLAADPVFAENKELSPTLNSRFNIYLGGFFPEVSSNIGINGETLPPGPGIDFEDAFRLEKSNSVLWGGASWRMSRRNTLEFEIVQLNRSGQVTVVTDPIQIGDSIVQAGAQIDTKFNTTIARLTYGFSVIRSERMDLQLQAGLHLADLSAALKLTGAVCVDGEVPPNCSIFAASPQQEDQDITAPMPHLGASFVYAFTPSVTMRLQLIGFTIELDNIKGSLVEFDADMVWQPLQHLGIGAGLRYFDTSIKSKGSRLNGEFEFEYFGPAVYGILTF